VSKIEKASPQPTEVEIVRLKIAKALADPVNGAMFREKLNVSIQSIIGGRVIRKCGFLSSAEDLSASRGESLIYNQRACEIYRGKVFLARNIWEDHSDIRTREEIPIWEFRVSGEQFFVKNLPSVPVIRCDGKVPEQDRPRLNKNYVLLDAEYNLI